jgi:uncharacterized protein
VAGSAFAATNASLRGIHAVDSKVIWASGAKGTFLVSTDAGANWRAGVVPGAEMLDFRSVYAFSATSAYLLSSGPGDKSKLFETSDAGEHWALLYTASDGFLDGLEFWDRTHGIILGDQVGGSFVILTTADAGKTWARQTLPAALPEEGGFAASNSSLGVRGAGDAWFGTSGARVFHTADGGKTWSVVQTPIRHDSKSAGIFSLCFLDEGNGIAVGGEYTKPKEDAHNIALTSDGGLTWTEPDSRPGGYRSAVVCEGQRCFATGPGGSDLSRDGGKTWSGLAGVGFHALTLAGQVVRASGADGLLGQLTDWRDEGVLFLDRSPLAKMHPVPVHAVTMGQGFWYNRRKVNVERSMPTMYDLLEVNGILDNFRKVSGRKTDVSIRGPIYTDSDIYKWIEAAAFSLQSGPNADLQMRIDKAIDEIAAAQQPDGYLHTHIKDADRFTRMTRDHELYCLGHMLQGAIAYYRATGNRRLLDVGIRYVNYIADRRPLLTGHPELELALVELYRTTGEKKALELAGYLLSGVETERLKLKVSETNYMFSGVPFTSRTKFVGHAVRAMYASSGATDYFLETGDAAYGKTLNTLWDDLVQHKLYVTGGVGSRASGEAFGESWELPNAQAYGESCAAIGALMWNFRMLAATGEAKFTDVLERSLYNGINSGMSLDGTLYCYRNPLSWSGNDPNDKIRNPWYDTTCCPPNIERTLSSLPGHFYATSADGLWVHLYHNSEMDWHLENGTGLKVKQETEYPWKGAVKITVSPEKDAEFTMRLRIPGWSASSRVSVNGVAQKGVEAGKYLAIRRTWKSGDRVELAFDMQPEVLSANPLVSEDAGKVAVQRGPLVYCLEQQDQTGKVADLSLAKPGDKFTEEYRGDLLGGLVMLKHAGTIYEKPLADEPLYQALNQARPVKPIELRLIPYYAWSNRGPGAMTVWIPLAH